MCKPALMNHSETLYKALLGYCLDVSDSSTNITFIPVVTWKSELLKSLIFSPVFTDHEA